jgi:hypothetical protein
VVYVVVAAATAPFFVLLSDVSGRRESQTGFGKGVRGKLLRGRKTGFRGADGWGLLLVTPWAAMVNMKVIESEDVFITST